MKIAYLDCFSGISGDMFLGALLDAGLPFEELRNALETLPLAGYSLEAAREGKNHLFGTRFLVKVDRDRQHHRTLKDIRNIIQAGGLSQETKDRSTHIFEAIAREEGRIHDRPPEEVHFHEVGAIDSIIDIVGTVFAIESMGISSLAASSLPLGSGFVETQHGRIPLPAPATIALLKGVPVHDTGLPHELVTPTGAALVAGLAGSFGVMPSMMVEKVGYGVGTRDLPDRPNLLRIILGLARSRDRIETVVMLETNVDDANPEWLGYLMDRLFEAGALDVVFCPVHMKKNRPGTMVQVMAKPHERDALTAILFRESTTLGVRFHYCQRTVLDRALSEMDSPWGKITVKEILHPVGARVFLPEYGACRKIAEEKGVPLKEVYAWVIAAGRK